MFIEQTKLRCGTLTGIYWHKMGWGRKYIWFLLCKVTKQTKTVYAFANNRHICLHRVSKLPYCRSRPERAPAQGLPDVKGYIQ